MVYRLLCESLITTVSYQYFRLQLATAMPRFGQYTSDYRRWSGLFCGGELAPALLLSCYAHR